jgi:oxygen-independent coproporphyrinogen-3 oxidase
VSFGVQSFRDSELQRLGRLHSADRAVAAFEEARAAGFDNISLDLMMWLPAQSAGDWAESVDRLIQVGPDHVSLYLLELYPNAPLRDHMARAGWSLAPDEDAAEMYLRVRRLDGEEQHEISTSAGRRSRAI